MSYKIGIFQMLEEGGWGRGRGVSDRTLLVAGDRNPI